MQYYNELDRVVYLPNFQYSTTSRKRCNTYSGSDIAISPGSFSTQPRVVSDAIAVELNDGEDLLSLSVLNHES